MGNSALWLSQHEKVQVKEIVRNRHQRYAVPLYCVILSDGSQRWIQRNDIVLEEEEKLIDELARILYRSKYPARHVRYAEIMRHLLANGVPYVERLQSKKPQQVQQMELNDVS